MGSCVDAVRIGDEQTDHGHRLDQYEKSTQNDRHIFPALIRICLPLLKPSENIPYTIHPEQDHADDADHNTGCNLFTVIHIIVGYQKSEKPDDPRCDHRPLPRPPLQHNKNSNDHADPYKDRTIGIAAVPRPIYLAAICLDQFLVQEQVLDIATQTHRKDQCMQKTSYSIRKQRQDQCTDRNRRQGYPQKHPEEIACTKEQFPHIPGKDLQRSQDPHHHYRKEHDQGREQEAPLGGFDHFLTDPGRGIYICTLVCLCLPLEGG